MTREELVKEADKYALEWGDKTDGTYACCRDGYLAGAEPREKRIEELEAQIEKMKCCENCAKEFTKDCAWWKRAEENRQINTCKDWELKK